MLEPTGNYTALLSSIHEVPVTTLYRHKNGSIKENLLNCITRNVNTAAYLSVNSGIAPPMTGVDLVTTEAAEFDPVFKKYLEKQNNI